jgi:hypothetical protein
MKMKRFLKLVHLLAILVLIGCSRGQNGGMALPSPVVSASPIWFSPTQDMALTSPSINPLNQTTATLLPILSKTPTETPIPPTIDPTYLNFPSVTPSPTLDPSRILLRIVSPGPMSKVISPIDFIVHIAPDYAGTTRIELIGEDGAKLYSKDYKTYSNVGYYTRLEDKINFEIKGAAEMARLQISTFDEKKRLKAFNSVRILLQAVGENEFTPPYALQDRVLLRYPKRGDEIFGGDLPVTGEFQPANDKPIVLELIDINGNVIGSRILQLGPADGKYQQFTTTIPYQLAKKTQARLVIRQSDDRMDGLAYLYSIKLVVGP